MKMKKWFRDFFVPEDFNDMNVAAIAEAFNDAAVRSKWLSDQFEEIRRINLEIDRRLLNGGMEYGLTDLCARRKALQDVLEGVLGAKRAVLAQDVRPNPRPSVVDLDRVTA